MRAWYVVKLIYSLLRVSREPRNTAAGLAIADCLYKLGKIADEANHLRQLPECRSFIERRALLPPPDLQRLQNLPEGTLGREYSNRMLMEKLDPDFYKILEIKDDETFIMMSLRRTHDLWHVITDFDTTVPGELALQAFMMAQTHSPLAPFLIAGTLFAAALNDPRRAREIIEHVSRGWEMGSRASPLFSLDWEKNWGAPLPELRRQYGIRIA
jgi:ubiquinone biosynthesis protein Coq4